MTAAKILIDDEGRVQTDAETLALLKNREFEVTREGQSLRLQSRPLAVFEIEDPQERLQLARELLAQMGQWKGPRWPDGYNVRDEIYD